MSLSRVMRVTRRSISPRERGSAERAPSKPAQIVLSAGSLDAVFDPVFVHDLRGRLVEVNRHACEALGYSREELLGMTVGDIECGVRKVDLQTMWRTLLAAGSATSRGEHRRKDGTRFPVELRLRPVISKGRKFILAVARDGSAGRDRDIAARRLAALSPREIEVLKCLVDGKSSKMIAQDMKLSIKTIENHRASMLRKSEAANIAELVRLAMQANIV